MPNWCENSVMVSGDVAELQRFKEFVCDGDKEFSLDTICPMPDALLHVRAPVRIVDTEEEVQKIIQEQEDNYLTGVYPITKETQAKFRQEYGADNWYDWRIQNWGVKWDVDVVIFIEDDNVLDYQFDTAWQPPEPICSLLREEFPNLEITWVYNDPNIQLMGCLCLPKLNNI